jgi:hypothetical protein
MRGNRLHITWMAIWTLSVPAVLLAADTASDPARSAAELWNAYRKADVNSPEMLQAEGKLKELIAAVPAGQKVVVAAAMMRRGEDIDTKAANAAALELFGTDGLPTDGLRAILTHEKRSWPQRMLLRTCYQLCRPDAETKLTEAARRVLLGLLADRLNQFAAAKQVDYGEQRLMVHLLGAVLSRYTGQAAAVPEMAKLDAALRAYLAHQRKDDVLAVSIAAWLRMPAEPDINSDAVALQALGHWDEMARQRASTYLASKIRKDPAVGDKVLALLGDPRDEVRAAAADVFSYALSYNPAKVIPAMVKLVVWDRGVVVQRAAAGTLMAHADEAQITTDLLLEALITRKPHPGPRRADSILETLSYLVGDKTSGNQKRRLLEVAVANLQFAPDGALKALAALGPDARTAVPDIVQYRDAKADRVTRQTINRQVLMAIDPSAVKKEDR